MIDLTKAKDAFKQYLEDYNTQDGNIKLKEKHTYGVVKASEYIAKGLGLDEENIKLAKLIALLHDIGRFEQVKKTNSFADYKGFNHAEYGVKVLFEENLIRQFIQDNQYDFIIYKSILNHNKYEIEKGLYETELLHAKLIRDADKLDNFRVKETENFENMFSIEYSKETMEYETVTDKVYHDFMNQKTIISTDRETQIDIWISYIAFLFDLNFNISLKYIKDKNYIDILVDRVKYKNEDTKNKMEQIRNCAKKYIDEKIK